MESYLNVDQLSAERLLGEWRWLCTAPVSLIARNAFGDLFLRGESGNVFMLDVSAGQLTEIAETLDQFLSLVETPGKRRDWLAEDDEKAAAQQGFVADSVQCIGFKMPLAFRESAATVDNMYVADLYEYVSFLGDLHHQMANLPNGARVKLRIVK